MARLLPPYYKEDCASDAEIKLFRAFEQLDMDYTVLHSLCLKDHTEKVFGEIDFVVICNMGILCLEVKGGAVYRQEGLWHFEGRYGNVTSTEGPFKQVVQNMFSLRNYLKDLLGNGHPLVRCQYACGVVFPDIVFRRSGPDIIPEIVFDAACSDTELGQYIKRVFDYWRSTTQKQHGFEGDYLTRQHISRAVGLLRGNFSCVPSIGSIVAEIDRKLVDLTSEQYSVLRMIGENPRVIIKGKAGSGKTLLALEHARRELAAGNSVLYLCFNKLISGYLSHQLSQESEEKNLEIIHFHGFLDRYIGGESQSEAHNDPTYFTSEMPERFLEYCLNYGLEKRYDTLIIDEGQDLLRPAYLVCMDELVQGGLSDGSWYVFYDPNQNIYNEEFDEGYRMLQEYRPAMAALEINCRNTIQIGTYNRLLTGLDPGSILKVKGEDVVPVEYHDKKDLRFKVRKLVKDLLHKGVEPGDIAILSPYSLRNSGLEGQNIFESICKFQDLSGGKYHVMLKDSLKFSTVQSFKGMESKVVILIDMQRFASQGVRLLNYTAISRAKALLHIFYNRDSAEEMSSVMEESRRRYGGCELNLH